MAEPPHFFMHGCSVATAIVSSSMLKAAASFSTSSFTHIQLHAALAAS
jgi:hypothetical protein